MTKATTPKSNANRADNISTYTFLFTALIRLDLNVYCFLIKTIMIPWNFTTLILIVFLLKFKSFIKTKSPVIIRVLNNGI